MRRISVAGIATGLGILVPSLWLLAPLGLSLFFYTLWSAPRVRDALVYGMLFGTITGGLAIWWFWDTLPIDWLGIPDPIVSFFAVGITWLYIALWLGAGVAFISIPLWYLRRSALAPVAAGLLWVLGEELRMWGFALGTLAPQSLFGAHFSAASIGYVLAEHPVLLQLAEPFGSAALTFTVALGAALVAFSIQTKKHPVLSGTLSLIALGALMYTPLMNALGPQDTESASKTRIAVLATNMPAGSFRFESLQPLLQEAAESGAQVILMPEDIPLENVFAMPAEHRGFMETHFEGRNVLIIHSGYERKVLPTDRFHGSEQLVYETTNGEVLGIYQKMFLMPLGEYTPYFSDIFYAPFSDTALKRRLFVRKYDIERGEVPVALSYAGVTFGSLLCSELLSPSLYNALVQEYGATVLINLANQAWFHGSRTLYDKTVQIAKVHAVQNRTYFIAAVNNAPSFVISRDGTRTQSTAWGMDEVLYVSLP